MKRAPVRLFPIRVGFLVCLLACGLGATPASAAVDCTTPDVKRRIPHAGATEDLLIVRIDLEDKEAFSICIDKTDPRLFSYELVGVRELGVRGADTETSVKLSHVHDDQFGGYFLYVRRNDVADPENTLKPMTVAIVVNTQGWAIESAGAFTGNSLTDPKYYVSGEGDSAQVLEDAPRSLFGRSPLVSESQKRVGPPTTLGPPSVSGTV